MSQTLEIQKKLQSYLIPEEEVIYAVDLGSLVDKIFLRQKYAMATNKRFIALDKSLFKSKHIDAPYDSITRMEIRKIIEKKNVLWAIIFAIIGMAAGGGAMILFLLLALGLVTSSVQSALFLTINTAGTETISSKGSKLLTLQNIIREQQLKKK